MNNLYDSVLDIPSIHFKESENKVFFTFYMLLFQLGGDRMFSNQTQYPDLCFSLELEAGVRIFR